ncbi:MAG: hypothetical protein SF029_26785 [bacterium]|nr:hypothetical protein [bacterium]
MMRRGTAANEEIVNRANYLLDGAAMHDARLQGLRTLHVVLQAALLLTGLAVVIVLFLLSEVVKSGLALGLLILLSQMQQRVGQRMRQLILASAEDVNTWQQKLICLENELPENQRYFTEFKIEQKTRGADATYVENLRQTFLQQRQIDMQDAYRLVERGSGHFHWMLEDEMPGWFNNLWLVLVLVSIAYEVFLLAHALI